ncbi:ATP-dependent DNA helicase PIF1-like protein [Tanacetum coccineum]
MTLTLNSPSPDKSQVHLSLEDERTTEFIIEEILIDATIDLVTYIIDFTYPNILDNINDPSYFQEKEILTPTNELTDNINEHLLEKFPGEEMVYLSCNDATPHGCDECVC